MVESTIVTGKALLTSTSLAMRRTCNSLIVLGSFSDGLLQLSSVLARAVHRVVTEGISAEQAMEGKTVCPLW